MTWGFFHSDTGKIHAAARCILWNRKRAPLCFQSPIAEGGGDDVKFDNKIEVWKTCRKSSLTTKPEALASWFSLGRAHYFSKLCKNIEVDIAVRHGDDTKTNNSYFCKGIRFAPSWSQSTNRRGVPTSTDGPENAANICDVLCIPLVLGPPRERYMHGCGMNVWVRKWQ